VIGKRLSKYPHNRKRCCKKGKRTEATPSRPKVQLLGGGNREIKVRTCLESERGRRERERIPRIKPFKIGLKRYRLKWDDSTGKKAKTGGGSTGGLSLRRLIASKLQFHKRTSWLKKSRATESVGVKGCCAEPSIKKIGDFTKGEKNGGKRKEHLCKHYPCPKKNVSHC